MMFIIPFLLLLVLTPTIYLLRWEKRRFFERTRFYYNDSEISHIINGIEMSSFREMKDKTQSLIDQNAISVGFKANLEHYKKDHS